jgi:hypothetical protein
VPSSRASDSRTSTSRQRPRSRSSRGSSPGRATRAFEVVETSGFFQIVPPALGFDLHASTIAAAKSSVIESGVTSGDEIDALECSLRAAEDGGHNWVTTPSYLALTARAQPS